MQEKSSLLSHGKNGSFFSFKYANEKGASFRWEHAVSFCL